MRARNIKPGFFKNELLGSCDVHTQLLFAGLWTLADRDGRLEDRPLRIKAEIFPYRDGLDIAKFLTELVSLDFIERYEVAGASYIQIKNFKKHQTPHKTEKLSEIPHKALENNPSSASSVKEEIITAALPPDSLIHPFTDSLIPEDTAEATSESFASPVDFKKSLFTDGLKLIGGESKRTLLGKWLRDYGEGNVIAAFLSCQRNSAVEPISYIEKILREGKNAKHSGNTTRPKSWTGAGQELAAKYAAEAEREEQAAISNFVEPSLRIAESIREIPG